MVQNSYAYDVDQWKTDMSAAKFVGIDGMAPKIRQEDLRIGC